MNKEYYIKIDGQLIPVTEEVYFAFKRPAWRERKRRQVRSGKEQSLDALVDEGFDVSDESALVDEIVGDKLLLDMLFEALSELTDDERSLIDELFYQDKSEREVARETDIHRNTLSYRKNKILAKLKKIIKNM